MLFSNVRLERVACGTELVAVGAREAVRAEMFGLNMVVDSGGVAGGVITIRTAV